MEIISERRAIACALAALGVNGKQTTEAQARPCVCSCVCLLFISARQFHSRLHELIRSNNGREKKRRRDGGTIIMVQRGGKMASNYVGLLQDGGAWRWSRPGRRSAETGGESFERGERSWTRELWTGGLAAHSAHRFRELEIWPRSLRLLQNSQSVVFREQTPKAWPRWRGGGGGLWGTFHGQQIHRCSLRPREEDYFSSIRVA